MGSLVLRFIMTVTHRGAADNESWGPASDGARGSAGAKPPGSQGSQARHGRKGVRGGGAPRIS
jgi:hypothetical protein